MDFLTPLIIMVILCLTTGIKYKMTRKKSLSEDSTMLNVFPSYETWRTTEIMTEKQIYFEALFSKASYKRECEHETILKPVYFYPGNTIRIECFMCNIALVLNGSPKGWARVENIDDFMEKGEQFGSKDGPEINYIRNPEFFEDKTAVPSNKTLGEPYYRQEDGFLVIENANVYSQGVYFCFDEDSVASQRHFHVLIPIIPVFHISKLHVDKIKEISKGCSNSARSFPDHNWIASNEEELFDDQETCFNRNGFDDWSCYDYRKSVRIAGCENPASFCKTALLAPNLPLENPLSISLQWSPWSECKNKIQTRIGQCFLSLDRQLSGLDSLPKRWNWLVKLNRMRNNIAFKKGIPLFNALLASWLYEVKHLRSCLDTELGEESNIHGYDLFFSHVFTTVLSNKTNEFKSPESALKYCIKYEKLDQKYDALLGTDTKDTRAC